MKATVINPTRKKRVVKKKKTTTKKKTVKKKNPAIPKKTAVSVYNYFTSIIPMLEKELFGKKSIEVKLSKDDLSKFKAVQKEFKKHL